MLRACAVAALALVPSMAWAVPIPTTGSATGLASGTGTLNGTVDPGGGPADAWFEWGTTASYGNATPHTSLAASSSPAAVQHTLTGLTYGDVIHFRVVGDDGGGAQNGADQTFTVPDTVPPPRPR